MLGYINAFGLYTLASATGDSARPAGRRTLAGAVERIVL
jgi:hypothetical protein